MADCAEVDVAYIFVMLGVVRRQIAIQIILLDVILYSAGGVLGTIPLPS